MKRVIKLEKDKLMEAISLIKESVANTLGPAGKTTIISTSGIPIVTKDGVTIVKSLEDPDPVINTIYRIIGESAKAVSSTAGDGTTTATLITCTFIDNLLNSGIELNHRDREIIMDIITKLIDDIKNSEYVCLKEGEYDKDNEDHKNIIKKVAMVSANGDHVISDLAIDAVNYVGTDGLVIIGYNRTAETKIEKESGYRIMKGLASQLFSSDKVGYSVFMENPIVLVGNKPIDTIMDIIGIVDEAVKSGRPLVIFNNAVSNDAMSVLIRNVQNGNLNCAVFGIPGAGNTVEHYAEDIAKFADVPMINIESPDTYQSIFEANQDMFINNNIMSLIGNLGSVTLVPKKLDKIIERSEELKKLAEVEENPSIKDEYKRRSSALLGKIATIRIGADTNIAKQERIDRLDDTVHAIQSTIKMGAVYGGGISLFDFSKNITKYTDDQRLITSISAALEGPKNYISKTTNKDITLDIMKENEIFDPYESVAIAAKAGISAGLNLITSSTIICEEK